MGVKGSWQRKGQGYAEGWDAIFGKKEPIPSWGDGCKCTWSQRMLGDGCDVCSHKDKVTKED